MKYFYPIILVCCLSACEKKPPPRPLEDLTGHWHLFYHTVFQNDTFNREIPVDLYITDQNLPRYKWPYRQTSETGVIDRIRLKINFYDDYNSYNWSWQNDSTVQLFLSEPNPNRQTLTLHRRNNGFEHQRYDYFRNHPKPLLLPSTSTLPRFLPDLALVSYLYLKEVSPDSLLYQLGDKTLPNVDDYHLNLYDEQHRVKLPLGKQSQIVKAIFTDATTSLTSLRTIANHYEKKGRDSLFFAIATPAPSDTFRVNYQPIAVSDLVKKEGVLQDFIK